MPASNLHKLCLGFSIPQHLRIEGLSQNFCDFQLLRACFSLNVAHSHEFSPQNLHTLQSVCEFNNLIHVWWTYKLSMVMLYRELFLELHSLYFYYFFVFLPFEDSYRVTSLGHIETSAQDRDLQCLTFNTHGPSNYSSLSRVLVTAVNIIILKGGVNILGKIF